MKIIFKDYLEKEKKEKKDINYYKNMKKGIIKMK